MGSSAIAGRSRSFGPLDEAEDVGDNPGVPEGWGSAETVDVLWPALLIALTQAELPSPRFERLDSGLQVVVIEEDALPLVSVQLWYGVGSADDPPGRAGLCAVVRSILEQRRDAALRLRAAGVRFESRTLRDACCFCSVLPPDLLDDVLSIEAARMQPLTVTAEQLERGLTTASRQYARQADDPDEVLLRHVLKAMFPDHPYEYPPGFVAASLKGLSADEVNTCLARWFVPGNATLFVIGDVSTPRVLEQVRRNFGGLEWYEPPRRGEPGPLDVETLKLSVRLRDPQQPGRGGVVIAWRTPPLGRFENAAIDVLMEHLCNEVDGTLVRALQAELGRFDQNAIVGTAWTPRWKHHAWRDAGLLVLTVDHLEAAAGAKTWFTDDGRRDALREKILRIVVNELHAAATRISSEIGHNRARAMAQRRVLQHRDALASYAEELAEYQMIGGDLLLADFSTAQIRGVGVEDVQEAARLLCDTRCVALVYLSDAAGSQRETGQQLAPALRSEPPPPADERAIFERVMACAADAPRVAPPRRRPHVEFHTCGPLRIKTCQLPGPLCTFVLTVRSVNDRGRPWLMLEHDYPAAFDADETARMIDYMSYHGIRLEPAGAAGGSGLCCWLKADQVPAAVEWQARMLRSSAPKAGEAAAGDGCVEIISVGDVAPDELEGLARQHWADWSPPAEHKPPAEHGPAASLETHAAKPGLDITWEETDDADVRLSLVMELPAGEVADRFAGLDIDALALLLGRVSYGDASWDENCVPLWRVRIAEQSTLEAQARVPRADWEGTLRRFWERLELVRKGTVPNGQVRAALNLARVERLVSLDHAWNIAESLWRNRADPWDIHEELTPERFRAAVGSALQSTRTRIRVRSAEDLSAAAATLEKELGASDD